MWESFSNEQKVANNGKRADNNQNTATIRYDFARLVSGVLPCDNVKLHKSLVLVKLLTDLVISKRSYRYCLSDVRPKCLVIEKFEK